METKVKKTIISVFASVVIATIVVAYELSTELDAPAATASTDTVKIPKRNTTNDLPEQLVTGPITPTLRGDRPNVPVHKLNRSESLAIDATLQGQPEKGGDPMTRSENQRIFLNDSFAKEPYDASWSIDMETALTEQVTKAAQQNSQLAEITCRTTMCRIVLEHSDELAEQQFVAQLTNVSQYSVDGEQGLYLRTIDHADRVLATYYHARIGHSLPLVSDP